MLVSSLFYAGSFDGLMMGKTLSEFSDPLKVLYECRRILQDDGALFMMHLLQSKTWVTKLLQQSICFAGLQFWNIDESNQLFDQAGFSVAEQFNREAVCFSKLVPSQ